MTKSSEVSYNCLAILCFLYQSVNCPLPALSRLLLFLTHWWVSFVLRLSTPFVSILSSRDSRGSVSGFCFFEIAHLRFWISCYSTIVLVFDWVRNFFRVVILHSSIVHGWLRRFILPAISALQYQSSLFCVKLTRKHLMYQGCLESVYTPVAISDTRTALATASPRTVGSTPRTAWSTL